MQKANSGRRLLTFAAVALLIGVAILARWYGSERLAAGVESLGAWGPAALAIVYVPATVFMFPGTIITLAAGYFFGVVRGTIAVSIGSTVGATLAFLIGRYLARPWVQNLLKSRPSLERLDAAAGRRGFLMVLLVRLSPAFPFNVVNYAFSVTSVRLRDYVLGSWLGMLPGTTMYVYFGSTVEDLSDALAGRMPGNVGLRIVGLATAIVFALASAWLAKRELSRPSDRKLNSASSADNEPK